MQQPHCPRPKTISTLRLDGHTSIAAANRHHARDRSGRSSYFKLYEYDFAGSWACNEPKCFL
jgi:hypothetical protein